MGLSSVPCLPPRCLPAYSPSAFQRARETAFISFQHISVTEKSPKTVKLFNVSHRTYWQVFAVSPWEAVAAEGPWEAGRQQTGGFGSPGSCPRNASSAPCGATASCCSGARGESGFVPMLLPRHLLMPCVLPEIIIICIENAGCVDIFRVIKL